MAQPRLLDLFCGAGGAAAGYYNAGFEVVGVDCKPQPNYPFAFIQADALAYLSTGAGRGYDCVHASPPCQAYSKGAGMAGTRHLHPDLIDPVRQLLVAIGLPWVIENVEQAGTTGGALDASLLLCGTMFGLGVFRHRLFETSFLVMQPEHPPHRGRVGDGRYVTVAGNAGGSSRRDGWKNGGVADWRRAMGIDWMTGRELAQAIPPAYTHHIGRHLINVV